jgi:AGCS family alanine or glycine:cation symporter
LRYRDPLPSTALTVLTGSESRNFTGGLSILSDIFLSHLGALGPIILFLSVLAFAFSTVICWFYYGTVCREYILSGRGGALYLTLYLIFFIFSYRIDYALIIYLTDLSLFALTVISLSAVIKNAKAGDIAPSFRAKNLKLNDQASSRI